MARLPHGYTNLTRLVTPNVVQKTFDGPRRWDNARRELTCLRHLAGLLPVPEALDSDPSIPGIELRAAAGRHGQDLIDERHGPLVLRLVGATWRELQTISPAMVPGLGDGSVVVHGDFGPQNMLFDVEAEAVTAILDWESAHIGDAIEDLAWAEWIVRMHHPHAVPALDELFAGAGTRPPWQSRQNALVWRCHEILVSCETAEPRGRTELWRQRLVETEQWSVE